MLPEMFVPLAGALIPSTPSASASVTSAATSAGFSFGGTVIFAAILAILFLLALVRVAAAVLPRLVQALLVLGSAILVAGVLGSVLLLLQNAYQAVRPR
jgi:uncharacterized membrane protein